VVILLAAVKLLGQFKILRGHISLNEKVLQAEAREKCFDNPSL
jgi:hypothetical protein